MERNNESWLSHLNGSGSVQQAALMDLRNALLGGLRRALSTQSRADDAFVEDTVQESLLRILDSLGRFEGRSRFVTWATSIAIHVAWSELRRRRWRDVSLDQLVADADIAPQAAIDASATADVQYERRAILDRLQDAINNELTPRQRTALLAELKGAPQDEIARQLGSNRNAVYKLTHDARRRLKQRLEAAGYGAADVQSAFSP